MRFALCGTFLATLIFGGSTQASSEALAEKKSGNVIAQIPVPAYLVLSKASDAEGDKKQKQSLFGLDVVLNINKTEIPAPSYLNVDGNYEQEVGAGASLIIPSLSFPLDLLFPNYPPFNFTIGFNTNKNMSIAVNAAKANVTTTPPPGWGWNAQSTTQGWSWSSPPPTTQAWSAPPPSSSPPQGWGWAPQPTAAPPSGWAPSSTAAPTPPPAPGWLSASNSDVGPSFGPNPDQILNANAGKDPEPYPGYNQLFNQINPSKTPPRPSNIGGR